MKLASCLKNLRDCSSDGTINGGLHSAEQNEIQTLVKSVLINIITNTFLIN